MPLAREASVAVGADRGHGAAADVLQDQQQGFPLEIHTQREGSLAGILMYLLSASTASGANVSMPSSPARNSSWWRMLLCPAARRSATPWPNSCSAAVSSVCAKVSCYSKLESKQASKPASEQAREQESHLLEGELLRQHELALDVEH